MPREATKAKEPNFPASLLKGEEEAFSRVFIKRGLGLEGQLGIRDWPWSRMETAISSANLILSGLEDSLQTTLPADQLATLQLRMNQVETRIADLEERQLNTFATFLNTLNDTALQIRRPIAVIVDIGSDGDVVARWTEALLEGEGSSQIEALDDLREAIVDAFLDLREALQENKKLSGYPDRLWRLLSEFVSSDAAATGE